MATLIKQPSETKIYQIDFTNLLDTGDSIASVTSVLEETTEDLTIGTDSIVSKAVQFSVDGGVDGTTYHLEAIVVTTNGETLEGDGYLFVTDTPEDDISRRLNYNSFCVAVADMLSWGRNTEGVGTAWDTTDTARLSDVIHSAYLQFLYPPILPGEKTAHRWSFLRPTAPITTVASTYLYNMPATFGAIVGDMVYDESHDESQVIRQVSPGYIDRQRAINDASGRPVIFALRPKSVAETATQVTECMLYPTPDAIYSLLYHYDAQVVRLSSTHQYALGGQGHDETLLQSCRDIAAHRFRDQPGGPEHDLFMQRLQASVEFDRRNSPQFLGHNRDRGANYITRHGSEFSCTLKHNLGGG